MRRRLFYWSIGLVSMLFIIELTLRALPVPTATMTGYYIDPIILTYPPHFQWRTSTGWDLKNPQRNRSNNYGFLADRDFEFDSEAVALIGDSFIEASMLDAHDRPGAQLERELRSRRVFAMGGAGSSLLDYAERIRFAAERFGVRDFVIFMERGDIKQSLCGSGNIHGPCLNRETLAPSVQTQAPPSALRKLLRHSAFAQYFVGQLRLSVAGLWRQALEQARPAMSGPLVAQHTTEGPPRNVQDRDQPSPAYAEVLQEFFERADRYVSGRLIIVLDADRRALYAGEAPRSGERDLLAETSQAHGATLIDTEPLYRAHLAHSSLSLDVGPYDGHLNALGVALVSQAMAEALLDASN